MKNLRKIHSFASEVWLYPGASAWHFASLPKKLAKEVGESFKHLHRGWTSLPVEAVIGKTLWRTSIFKDKRSETYLLPIKSEIRRKSGISAGDKIKISIKVLT